MKTLTIILACTTFCHQPAFKINDCTIDKIDKEPYTYRKIVDIDHSDYQYQIANRASDLNRHLYSYGDLEQFDASSIKVECPEWFK